MQRSALPLHSPSCPGAITYTTSTGPDGRVTCQLFKAVSSSVQIPDGGVVIVLSWIPIDVTSIPARVRVIESHVHTVGYPSCHHKEEQKSVQECQRLDEKRMKQEEQTERQVPEQGPPQNDPDHEQRLARARDAQSVAGRDQRKSFNAETAEHRSSVAFPPGAGSAVSHPSVGTAYPPSLCAGCEPPLTALGYASGAGSGHHRNSSTGNPADSAMQFNYLDVNAEREREASSELGRPQEYCTSDASYEQQRTLSGNYADRRDAYSPPSGPYPPASGPSVSSGYTPPPPSNAHPSHLTAPSPKVRLSDILYGDWHPRSQT